MALGYLLGAAIQFEDKNGKPLVGGTIRVCLHGTSTPYLTYRDFNGNRNPEYVPLNAAGMCVLIADDAGVYDVYCKDQFGVEQWSRLNVTVGGAGGGGGGGSYVAGDGILIVNDTISVDPSVVQDKLTAGNGIVIDGNDEISVDTTVIQEKLTAGSNITIDGSTISATDHDTTYTATAPIAIDSSNDISISLGNGLTTESGSLVIDTSVVRSVPDSDGTNEGQVLGVTNSSGDIGWVTVTPAGTVDQTYDPTSSNAQSGTAVAEAIAGVNEVPTATSGDNGKVLGVTDSQGHIGWVTDQDTTYSAGTGLTLTGTTFSVDNPVPTAQSSDNGKILGVTDSNGTIGWVTDQDTTYSAGTGLTLTGTTFAADTTVLATQNDLNGKQDALTAGTNITISNNVISATDTTYTFSTGLSENAGTVTVDNPVPTASGSDNGKVLGVTDAQGTIGWVTPTASQVQSDWTESDNTDPSYIQNKPAEKALVAGTGISITESLSAVTISSSAPSITRYESGGGGGPVYSNIDLRLASGNAILGKSSTDSNYESWGFAAPVTTSTGDDGKFLKVSVDSIGNQSVSWDTETTYTAGRNLHLNANNSFQTSLPGGTFEAPAEAGNNFVRITGADFASAYCIACHHTTSDTYELAIAYKASGTSHTYQFLGTETTVAIDNSMTTKSFVISDTAYFTPSTRWGGYHSTVFDPASHKAIIYDGIALIGQPSDCKIIIWDDNGVVKITFTDIEVGAVGAT